MNNFRNMIIVIIFIIVSSLIAEIYGFKYEILFDGIFLGAALISRIAFEIYEKIKFKSNKKKRGERY